MTNEVGTDPDVPPRAGRGARLHLRAGRLLISAVNTLRPRVTLGVRLVALDAEERVLLVRHTYMPGWHLPGGGVGPGETCGEAAEREAREEGGIVLPDKPRLFGIYLNRALANRDHVALYVARGAAQKRRGRSLEVREARFHALSALPEDVTAATRTRLAEVVGTKARSEYW